MTHYVALLRGINVGGNNIIKMADLKRCFEEAGLADVATFIQSGNVLFEAGDESSATLVTCIEDALTARFAYAARVILRSRAQIRAVVDGAPSGFGSDPNLYRYNVAFLRDPLTSAEAMEIIETREGVDEASPGEGVCYFTRLESRASQSYMNRLIGLPIYQQMTIRNWNTTVKLRDLLDARAED